MTDEQDTPRPRRRLKLSRETLRDLTPGPGEAAAIAGGATVTDPNCRLAERQMFSIRTTAVPGPQDLFEMHRTTAVLKGPSGPRPGRYVVEQTTRTEFEVLKTGEVIIRSTQVRDSEPKAL